MLNLVDRAVEDAHILVGKCFTEYREEVPSYELTNAFLKFFLSHHLDHILIYFL